MDYKVLKIECVRCAYVWNTRPTMMRKSKDGVPRNCPKCHKYLHTKNIQSYHILGVISEWGGDFKELSSEEEPKFKKTRKKREISDTSVSVKLESPKVVKVQKEQFVPFAFGSSTKSKKADKDLDIIMGW